MSKILKLKEWLSLEDAATHLSLIAETAVKPQDLVQFAIDGHIGLSLFMSDHVHASECYLADDGYPFHVLDCIVENCVLLSGLADFAQYGRTEFYSWLFTLLSTGDRPKGEPWIYLEKNSSVYQPMRLLRPNQFPNTSDEVVLLASSYLPDDSCVVIRVSELNKLEAALIGKPLDGRERVAYNNLLGALLDTLVNGKKGNGEKLTPFIDQQAVIDHLSVMYQGRYGISERSLEGKFAAANEAIKGQ